MGPGLDLLSPGQLWFLPTPSHLLDQSHQLHQSLFAADSRARLPSQLVLYPYRQGRFSGGELGDAFTGLRPDPGFMYPMLTHYLNPLPAATGVPDLRRVAWFVIAILVWTGSTCPTQAQLKSRDPIADRAHQLLQDYCLDCHSSGEPEAGLDLSVFKTVGELRDESDIWDKVQQRIASSSMPPPDYGELEEDDRKWLSQWIDDALHLIDCADRRYPGQVTVRRLTRSEYQNSIVDLLGVDYQPAADFPGDDVGYGFDNIGEVLSLPPVLMEKYLDAAEAISQQVIVTDDDWVPPTQHLPLKDFRTEGGVRAGGELVFYSNGTATAEFEASQPGKYNIKIVALGQQAGDEPCKMTVSLDGQRGKRFEIQQVDKNETVSLTRRFKAGKHSIAIRFENDYFNKDAPDGQKDRNLLVHDVSLTGPDSPSTNTALQDKFFFATPARPEEEGPIARHLLSVWASRFFRRPAADHEVDRLVQIYDAVRTDGASFEKGVQVALMAILVSPKFLYKVERPAPEDGTIRELSDFELATSLSYFLWSTTPDDELLQAARQGQLTDPDGLRQQVKRLLGSDRSQILIDNFASQWLQLRILENFEPDPKRFQGVDKPLLQDMRRETLLFCQEILREDRSILEMLDANYTYLNPRLAKHYGLANTELNKNDHPSDQFIRVSLENSQRGGLLTQASILAVTSNPTRTSPVKRGKWIMENLLGEPPPPAAPDVVPLDQQELTGTLRERMEQHRRDPACASCHRLMDPLGFALENFDAVGRWREKDEGGAIDSSGVLPSGESFQGVAELKTILTSTQKKKFVRCLTEKMLIYALGRGLRYEDQCTVNEIVERLEKNDYRFSELIVAVVESAPFRQRQIRMEE